MAKLTLTDIIAGYGSAAAQNANNVLIETALENTLSRDGTTPNSMEADLDMNGYSILNQLAISGDTNFSWRGNWATTTVYSANNLVYVTTAESSGNGGATYICTTDHTAGATFDSDLASYWTLFAKRGGAGAGTGDLLSTNNLSDVASAATSRTNLGLAIGTDVQGYDANTAKTDVAQEYTQQQNFNETALTDGANIAWDLDTAQETRVTLAGNRTLDNPTNQVQGSWYHIRVIQDATGSRTLSYGTDYKFGDAGAPTLSTAANAEDVLAFRSNGTYMQYMGTALGVQA